MIASIRGSLAFKSPEYLIIDVGGVGYQVFVPLSSFYVLPKVGDIVNLKIHTHLRDDAIHLYGFLTKEEREIFQSLISIQGIGPKLALNILSGISTQELIKAISEGDILTLSTIPGVGRKTAERLVLELKEKIGYIQESTLKHHELVSGQDKTQKRDHNYEDALSALVNLGYKKSEAEEALKRIHLEGDSVENLIKGSLRIFHRK